jgi:hypothetical protein
MLRRRASAYSWSRVRPLDLPRDDLLELRASPLCARCLFTVRAAISFARRVDTPRRFSDDLTCSYCRARFVPFLTPRGGI